jgi:voltage-gated potassium channel
VWYVIVTITTVGYGDKYPVTNPGRIVGVLIMVLGVGLFGVLTGFLANVFLAPASEKSDDNSTPASKTQPSANTDQEDATLSPDIGLVAKLDQLQAEMAELKALLQRQVAYQPGGSSSETQADKHGDGHSSS